MAARTGAAVIGKVDRLPPELKDTVEQHAADRKHLQGEIAAYLPENGEEMSQNGHLHLMPKKYSGPRWK
ncbi:MAG: hypothetical protein ACLSAC_17490 [Enterocloster bolteae]